MNNRLTMAMPAEGQREGDGSPDSRRNQGDRPKLVKMVQRMLCHYLNARTQARAMDVSRPWMRQARGRLRDDQQEKDGESRLTLRPSVRLYYDDRLVTSKHPKTFTT